MRVAYTSFRIDVTTEYTERTEGVCEGGARNTRKSRKGCGEMGLLFEEESFAIRGAIYEVYKNLGAGFLEAVYQEALEIELTTRRIPFKAQVDIDISYKGFPLHQTYRADIVCFDKIILELKAVKQLLPEHVAQLQNYLRATNMKLGMLVNFCGQKGVEVKRIVC